MILQMIGQTRTAEVYLFTQYAFFFSFEINVSLYALFITELCFC